MATYLGTHGSRIQNYTTDPDNPNTGEVWYNDTSNALKFQYENTTGAWATGGDLNTARSVQSGAGTYTSALMFAADQTPTNQLTETYNGTNWTEVNDLNTSIIKSVGFGATQSAAIRTTGATPPGSYSGVTEQWGGTNWATVNSTNQAREQVGSVSGSVTAGLVFGGQGPPPMQSVTELWNGTNWTEVNNLNTARYVLAGSGTTTAGLAFGGTPPVGGQTEEWSSSSTVIKTLTD